MKIVTLVRHAKSSWSDSTLPDIDRPLNKRGKRDAPRMAVRVAGRGARPDLLVSSPARRARKTAAAFAEALGVDHDAIRIDERVYHGDADDLLGILREQPDAIDHLMLFGHNPDLTDLVNRFDCAPIGNVPTCGVVELRLDVDRWADVDVTVPVVMDFDYPKRDGDGAS
jgi:phosphohistidine phosphatase